MTAHPGTPIPNGSTPSSNGAPRGPRLLVVCTANQCRSPFAAAVAAAEAERRGIRVDVESAGFLDPGFEAADRVQKVAADRGLDLSGHVSRHVGDVALDDVDVVLTMEGVHVVDLGTMRPGIRSRTLTLSQAVAALEEHPVTDPPLDGPGLRRWVARVVEAAGPGLAGVLDPRFDLPDPMGGTMRAHRRMADEVTDAVARLFDAWFCGPEPPDGPAGG